MNSNHAIGFLFERTTRIIKLSFYQLFKELDAPITPEQWVVMDVLYPKTVLTQKEIVEKSFKDAPSISRIILKLINNGYIQKTTDELDKRVFNIKLTKSGIDLVSRIKPRVQELRIKGLNSFEEEEVEKLIENINTIFNNYSK